MVIRVVLFLLCICSTPLLSAQGVRVNGKVIDGETGEGIPYASVGLQGIGRGTSTNYEGNFVFEADSIGQRLTVSHLSYGRQTFEITSTDFEIELVPAPIDLKTITVKGNKQKGYIEKLVLEAYDKTLKHGNRERYGRAFYRQKSKNGGQYSELFEIFFDTRISTLGIRDWGIQEGRYAMNTDENRLVNKNFTLLSRILMPIQPQTNDFIMPVGPDLSRHYDYKIERVQVIDSKKVAVISFDPYPDRKVPAWKGEVYIDIRNFDILKISGGFEDDRLSLVQLSDEGHWKNYRINYEMSFKSALDQRLGLDYVEINQKFDYYKEDEFQFPVETNSIITIYERYEPVKRKRLGGRIRYKRSDATELDRLGYDRNFWEENPVLMRTPIEEEVIAAFESKKAFGTIYLNDQKQIILQKNDINNDQFMQDLLVDYKQNFISSEKAYLHLDRPLYSPGEDIWYSAYLVDANSHLTNSPSNVLHVELIDPRGEVVQHQLINVNDGHAKGDIRLPDDSSEGKYLLTAYTQMMRNQDSGYFFQKELAVVAKAGAQEIESGSDDQISMRFFPEGGNLIANTPGQVAYKAVSKDGRGVTVTGSVLDPQKNVVGRIESNLLGLGSFYLAPISGVRYTAEVEYGGKTHAFELPVALESGITMQVNNTNPNTIKVVLRSTDEYDEQSYYLVGQVRGSIVHKSKGIFRKSGVVAELPKIGIPDGIMQLTLFDQERRPHCERLIFIDNDRDLSVSLEENNQPYLPREKVTLNLSVKDTDGNPVKGIFSVAITDESQVRKDEVRGNIHSYLLLSSDIKGRVEKPGHYFKDRSKATLRDLDLLMLTQGWRRFTWNQMLQKALTIVQFNPEQGFTMLGVALDPKERLPLKNTLLNAVFMDDSTSAMASVRTNDRGIFEMRNLYFSDSAKVYFSLPGIKNSLNKLEVLVDVIDSPVISPYNRDKSISTLASDDDIRKYLDKYQERRLLEKAREENVVVLEGVEVSSAQPVNSTADAIIVPDDRTYNDIFQMIAGQVPGVVVSGDGLGRAIRMRYSQGPPLVVIDGRMFIPTRTSLNGPITSLGPTFGASEGPGAAGVASAQYTNREAMEILASIPMTQIDRIEVLKGANAAVYGVYGGNGVLSVFTKTGMDARRVDNRMKLPSADVYGFYAAREFYSPDYEFIPDVIFPDKRATLYWNPQIETDQTGESTITFYTSDDATNFQVDIQGLSNHGEPFHSLVKIGSHQP